MIRLFARGSRGTSWATDGAAVGAKVLRNVAGEKC